MGKEGDEGRRGMSRRKRCKNRGSSEMRRTEDGKLEENDNKKERS
jgi:hypothetical protein